MKQKGVTRGSDTEGVKKGGAKYWIQTCRNHRQDQHLGSDGIQHFFRLLFQRTNLSVFNAVSGDQQEETPERICAHARKDQHNMTARHIKLIAVNKADRCPDVRSAKIKTIYTAFLFVSPPPPLSATPPFPSLPSFTSLISRRVSTTALDVLHHCTQDATNTFSLTERRASADSSLSAFKTSADSRAARSARPRSACITSDDSVWRMSCSVLRLDKEGVGRDGRVRRERAREALGRTQGLS